MDLETGVKRLQYAFISDIAGVVLALILMAFSGALTQAPENLGAVLGVLAVVGVLGLLALILAIVSWIFRVLGWSAICRTGLKKFYCITKWAVLLLPIIAVILFLVGMVYAFQKILATPQFGAPTLEGLGPLIIVAAAAILLTTVASLIEGVALLDLGMIGVNLVLKAGSILYLIATVGGVIWQAVSGGFSLSLTPSSMSAASILTMVLKLVYSGLIIYGLRTLKIGISEAEPPKEVSRVEPVA